MLTWISRALRASPANRDERQQALRLSVAALWATLLVAAWETWLTCRGLPELRVGLALQCLALNLAGMLRRFAPTHLFVAVLVTLAALPSLRARLGRARALVEFAAAGGAVLAAYATLALYPPFGAARTVWLAFLAIFAYASAACLLAHAGAASAGAAETKGFRWLSRASAALGLGAAVGAESLHSKLYLNEYPSLHLSLTQLSHLFAVLGLWQFLQKPWAMRWRFGRFAVASALSPCALLLASHALGLSEAARPQYRAASVFGLGELLFEPYSEAREVPGRSVPDQPGALQRFRERAGLPQLPDGFELSNYDVLLMMSEATRFDQTSLGNRSLATTPALLRLKERGAFSFARAYSPSSATFLSLSSIFGMSYPSLVPLETWNKSWTGRLLEASHTAAEAFRESGYDTFWVGHDHRGIFSQVLQGLDAGFAQRSLVAGDERTDTELDATIAARAIDALRARGPSASHFFGFVFFVSPHYPYLTHDPARPHGTELERYRQELAAMDLQVGRVLDALDASPRGQHTIVIFMGDHGEEFEEHGGHQHHSTVYTEALHVPLLVHIPGLAGGRIETPVSSAYILPWLLAHGSSRQRSAIEARLTRELGPLLEATNGAVIAEILGHDRVKSTLIYPHTAFVYDFFAERTEAYDLDRDPGELRDRFDLDPELAASARHSIQGYKDVRAARRRFRLRPDMLDPRNAR